MLSAGVTCLKGQQQSQDRSYPWGSRVTSGDTLLPLSISCYFPGAAVAITTDRVAGNDTQMLPHGSGVSSLTQASGVRVRCQWG